MLDNIENGRFGNIPEPDMPEGNDFEELTPESMAQLIKTFQTLKENRALKATEHAVINQKLNFAREMTDAMEGVGEEVPEWLTYGMQALTDLLAYEVEDTKEAA